MRGMLLLMPTGDSGVYELSAVKRGTRLGWTNPPDKKYLFPTKRIRQSPKEYHLLFWHEVDAADILASMKSKEKLNPETLANELVEVLAKANGPLTAGELRDKARERFGRKNGDEAYVFLVKNEEKLGVSVRKQKGSNIKLYSAGVLPL